MPSTAGERRCGTTWRVQLAAFVLLSAHASPAGADERLLSDSTQLNGYALPADPPYASPLPNPAPAGPPPNTPPAPAPSGPVYAAAPPAGEPPAPVFRASRRAFPDWSLRVDPANWLLYGRLGLHLEFELLDWLTLQTAPVFAVAQQPPLLFAGVQQDSNGLGPLAGASLEAGLWLSGHAFEGPVLRFGITNYGYRFRGVATDDLPPDYVRGETIDEATYTERRLLLLIGSVYRFGPLSLSGSLGIGYELNQVDRCLAQQPGEACDAFLIRRGRGSENDAADLHALGGPFYPVSLLGRVAIGVVFDD